MALGTQVGSEGAADKTAGTRDGDPHRSLFEAQTALDASRKPVGDNGGMATPPSHGSARTFCRGAVSLALWPTRLPGRMNRPTRCLHWILAAGLTPAVMPAQAPADATREEIELALDRARPALLAHLRAAVARPEPAGPLALLILACLHDGIPPDQALLAPAIQLLAKAEPDSTYALALRLVVMADCPAFPDRVKLAAADCKRLLRHRDRSGCFGYQPDSPEWDLSNTQYAALGLRAAQALGVKVAAEVWQRMGRQVAEQQDPQGGFGYARRRDTNHSYASMTVAGIGVLAICAQALPAGQAAADFARSIQRGWQWLARQSEAIGAKQREWSLYFHYGLERAAILCDVERVGEIDWYSRGAGMLVRSQLDAGGWVDHNVAMVSPLGNKLGDRSLRPGHGELVATSFAVLFLRRSFQKQLGPVTPHKVLLVNLGVHSKEADIEACAVGLIARGKEAVEDVLKALRSEVGPQRAAAAKALRALAGEGFGYDPALSPEQNREACRRAELWHLRQR